MWEIRHRKAFYKELSKLPAAVRGQIEEVAFSDTLKEDLFGKEKLERLKGYKEFYKMRFGNYRVGLKIDRKEKKIEFRRALHRKDIYRYFP